MAARHRHEVALHEHAIRLLGYAVDDVRDGLPVHRVELHVPSRVCDGLEGDAVHGGVVNAEPHDVADLVVVHALLDGGHEHDVEASLSQPVERLELQVDEVLPAHGLVGLC